MSEYTPLVSWETIIENPLPIIGEDFYYTCKVKSVNPNDYNPDELGELGTALIEKTDQFYITDYLGKVYKVVQVLDANAGEIKIYDLVEDTVDGPYVGEAAFVYQAKEEANVLTQAQRKRLHPTAYDMILNIENNVIRRFYKYLQFDTTYVPLVEKEGMLWWNSSDSTLNIATGLGGTVIQVGQEFLYKVYNNTSETLVDGTVIHPTGLLSPEGIPHVVPAQADNWENCFGTIGFITGIIAPGEWGFATTQGSIRNVDTSGVQTGFIYLSADYPGEFVSEAPSFPYYRLTLGGVTISNANGSIVAAPGGGIFDTFNEAWDGSIRETIRFITRSDGVDIIGTLTNQSFPLSNLTLMLSAGFHTFDTTSVPATVILTPGSSTIPQTNFVYISSADPSLLLSSTSDWPIDIEHIRVAQIAVLDAATTKLRGTIRNQNWNDHVKSYGGNGHILHIAEKLRQFEAQWYEGIEGSISFGAANEVWVNATSGVVYQLHRQSLSASNMTQFNIYSVNQGNNTFTVTGYGDISDVYSVGRYARINNSTLNDGIYRVTATNYSDPDFTITVEESIPSSIADGTLGDVATIVNNYEDIPTDNYAYRVVSDLSLIETDASGGTLLNRSFSIVVWGVNNKGGEPSHIMVNMPTDTFHKLDPESAVSDPNNYAVYTIPKTFQGVGFLVARFTFVNSSEVWTLFDYEDLRGRIPNTTAGGGSSGTGVTSFLALTDTPSAYLGSEKLVPVVNDSGTALEFISIRYTNAIETPEKVGGVEAGTTFDDQTIQEMFTQILYPYQYPSFGSFIIDSQATSLECGIEIAAGNHTFNWSTINPISIEDNSIIIRDETTLTDLATNLEDDGTEIVNIGVAITKTITAQNHQWEIRALNTQVPAVVFDRLFTITWYSPFYYGVGAPSLPVASIQALTKVVEGIGTKTYSFNPSAEKMYYAYPASYGDLTSIKDINNFEIIDSWTKTTGDFSNNPPNYNGITVSYNIYETNIVSTPPSGVFENTFIF